MYIKSVIIDGFKSYGHRVEIADFDREFNAITGFNGTGKSNILDAICFVLGITNLTQVRANSYQDLIYKSGQAGVTKASVTITFDNRDKSKSPISLENHDEFTVTRQIFSSGAIKNRYLLNGINVNNRLISDIFNSVHLNVNNPHFLIMQGRITKVLNMKPSEILSIVEEAVGTRLYQTKKECCEKILSKKESKFMETNRVMEADLSPAIDRIKEERAQYYELQKIEREIAQSEKLYVAFMYHRTVENRSRSEEKLLMVTNKMDKVNRTIAEIEKDIEDLELQIKELYQKRDKESSGVLGKTEESIKIAEKEENTLSIAYNNSVNNMLIEKKKLKLLEKGILDDQATLSLKIKVLNEIDGNYQEMKMEEANCLEALNKAEEKYKAISSGLFTDQEGSGDGSLQDKLLDIKKAMVDAENNKKHYVTQLEQNKADFKIKQAEVRKTESKFVEDQRELQHLENNIEKIKKELLTLNYQDGLVESLQQEKRDLSSKIRDLRSQVDNFENRNPRLSFQYRDPEPNFNKGSVKGLVCKLFRCKDNRFQVALEHAASGKLYNVIVDNELVSKKLIEKGQLRHRTTFVPLNKIYSNVMNASVIKTAQKLVGEEKVFPALSLINFKPEFRPVMEWAFGDVFICTDNTSANRITFDKNIKKKSVTLDGDVYDPSGIVHGGAPSKQLPILRQLNDFETIEGELNEARKRFSDIDTQIKSVTQIAERYGLLKNKLELAEHELVMVNHRLKQTSHYQKKEEVDALQANIQSLQNKIDECNKTVKDGAVKVTDLEKRVKNMKSERESELKVTEKELNRLRTMLENMRKKWQTNDQEVETLSMEVDGIKKGIDNSQHEIEKVKSNICEIKIKSEKLHQDHQIKTEELNELREKLANAKHDMMQQNSEISKINAQKNKKSSEIDKLKLCLLKDEGTKEKCMEELKQSKATLQSYEHKYKWIVTEMVNFGKQGGLFDFQGYNVESSRAALSKLKEKRDKINRAINVKATDINTEAEQQYKSLVVKRDTVVEDKKQIYFAIEKWDEKKKFSLEEAWLKINGDFGSIFGELLPGAFAKLDILPGKSVIDGLQIKVSLGGIWKNSLGELSGGQRSLVALSFILAMLLFKPAPIYILDEVDAALDLSHTQNIGKMLKLHFKHSQFIVVSLKEGMFNNANIIFRTRLKDGFSSVMRTTGNKE